MSSPTLLGLLALAVPLTSACAALPVAPARAVERAAELGLLLSALVAVGIGAGGAQGAGGVPLVRLDGVTAIVLLLVTFVGLVVARFSRHYLAGDRGVSRYSRWLAATLASVHALVITSDLRVIALAWVATSLSLHQLLTFYADRPQALVAAHKKFLVSRAADVCVVTGFGLLAWTVGSFDLGAVGAWAERTPQLPPTVEVAALLLVLGASVKCAQLPFHGWLLQVMEAPTPVSALLHAGVVNIGGFLMIRLAPVLSQAAPAQTALVAIGSATAVVAALVATTRPSVKVALAWSTCAQMGFMLVQCGLGAYDLALLHLVAHSTYKAHAFLSAGSAVERWRAHALAPAAAPPSAAAWLVALGVAVGAVLSVGAVAGHDTAEAPAHHAFALLSCVALAALVVGGVERGALRLLVLGSASVGVAALSFALHTVSGRVLPPAAQPFPTLRLVLVAVAFGGLFLVHAALRSRPDGALAGALHPPLSAGLWLDELFTRLTFRIWPPRLPPRPVHGHLTRVVPTPETRDGATELA